MATAVHFIATRQAVVEDWRAHRDPTRFTVEELQQEIRIRFRTAVIIEKDSRDNLIGGPVTLKLGFHADAARIVIRTLHVDTPERFLVYSVGYEQTSEHRVIRRYTAQEAAEGLHGSYPHFR